MSEQSQQIQFDQNTMYRDHYHFALKGLVAMVVLTVVLVCAVAYQAIVPKKQSFFATTTNGQVVPLSSMSQPVVTDPYLLQWASLATRSAFNIDFVHYQDQINKAGAYFTANGFDSFKNALNGNLLDDIQKNHLNMSVVVSGTPVILDSYNAHGRYTWDVQLPLLVTYTSASATQHSHMIATLRIQRVPVLDDRNSILITNISLG